MDHATFQTLYDRQDYATLVKQTAALSDLNMVRYHIIGLLGLGANQMVLTIMLAKFSLIQKALPIFLKIHYEILKTHRTFPEHAKLMEQYQNLPYISQEVEERVSQIQILYSKPVNAQVKDTLTLFQEAYDQEDHEMLFDLIPQLKPIHLFTLKQTIKTLLMRPFPQRMKGMLVLALIDAKYDEVISITKGEKTLSFNPIDTVNPFQDEAFTSYQDTINSLTKDPSVRQVAYSLLSTYMLTMIPFEIDPEYYFFQGLISLAYAYLKMPPPPFDGDESEQALIEKKRQHLEKILKM
jgi:hypothetical protein